MISFDDFPIPAKTFAEEFTAEAISPDLRQRMIDAMGSDQAEELMREMERVAQTTLYSLGDRLVSIDAAVHFANFISTVVVGDRIARGDIGGPVVD